LGGPDYAVGWTIRRAASAHGGGTTRRFGQRKTMRQLEPERHGRSLPFSAQKAAASEDPEVGSLAARLT
jgi:hypothetical protein